MKIFKGWNKLFKIIDIILQTVDNKSFCICNLSILEFSKNIADVDDEYEFFTIKFHVSFMAFKTTLV